MKLIFTASLSLVFGAVALAADAPAADAKGNTSYAIGFQFGSNLKRLPAELDPEQVSKGMSDALSGAKPALTEAQIGEVLNAFNERLAAKMQEKTSKDSAENKAKGEKFLADHGKEEGVKTTKSGLQYKVLTEGKGAKPKASDEVTVHYRGTLLDGTEFDSSYKRNEPVSFSLGQVIPGWTEGLQLMNVGSKYQLAIPAALAYGENAPPQIGPNQTLLFDVELLKIGAPAKDEKAPVTP